MHGFLPGLLDRLMDERKDAVPGAPWSLEQLKDSIARDLEALLNTRVAVDGATLGAALGSYPTARASILHYGVADFAGACLSSSVDRAALCAGLKDAIEIHEPRLREVSAVLVPEAGKVNRLHFVIHARLAIDSLAEPVNFNAVLQPSSLRYAIRHGVRNPIPD